MLSVFQEQCVGCLTETLTYVVCLSGTMCGVSY